MFAEGELVIAFRGCVGGQMSVLLSDIAWCTSQKSCNGECLRSQWKQFGRRKNFCCVDALGGLWPITFQGADGKVHSLQREKRSLQCDLVHSSDMCFPPKVLKRSLRWRLPVPQHKMLSLRECCGQVIKDSIFCSRSVLRSGVEYETAIETLSLPTPMKNYLCNRALYDN